MKIVLFRECLTLEPKLYVRTEGGNVYVLREGGWVGGNW